LAQEIFNKRAQGCALHQACTPACCLWQQGMSCLPSDALSHFEQREQELLALNQELEQKRAHALAEASSAVRDVESSSLHSRVLHAPEAPASQSVTSSLSAAPLQAQELSPEAASAAALLAAAAPRPASGSAAADGGTEALHTTIRLQNARIIALQEELDKTIAELASRDGEVQQLRQEVKQATDENRKLQKSNAAAEQNQDRAKKQIAATDSKMQDLERERAELLKERDQLDVQKRKLEAECGTKEARINRMTEECERYRATAKDASTQDRDRAAADRRETDRLTSEVRKLERQRAELVGAFKKQMKLIDVLKRQRAHVEAARVLSFTEDEFIRILELGDKLGD